MRGRRPPLAKTYRKKGDQGVINRRCQQPDRVSKQGSATVRESRIDRDTKSTKDTKEIGYLISLSASSGGMSAICKSRLPWLVAYRSAVARVITPLRSSFSSSPSKYCMPSSSD